MKNNENKKCEFIPTTNSLGMVAFVCKIHKKVGASFNPEKIYVREKCIKELIRRLQKFFGKTIIESEKTTKS